MDKPIDTLRPVLLVDDNEDDLFFATRLIKQAGIRNPIASASGGEEGVRYLIVSLRDAGGGELRAMPIDFVPRQIPRHGRPPSAVSTYRCPLDPFPANTATIVITARDDRPSS